MSGTAKEAERMQELRRRAAEGDQAARDKLDKGDSNTRPDPAAPHDPGNDPARPTG